jgi:hypothetical protein
VISRVGPGEKSGIIRFGYTHDVLLDKDQKILHKPFSAGHVEAWLKVKNNKKAAKALV